MRAGISCCERGDTIGLYVLNYVRAPRILDGHINLDVMNQSKYQ